MTRNDQELKNNDRIKNRKGGRNHFIETRMSQTKAIFKIKQANQNEHMIKASIKKSKGKDIKELIYMFQDGDPPELFLKLEKQFLKLGYRYDLFEGGRWKVLCQIGKKSTRRAGQKVLE